jgi:hypothetical protein
VAVCSNNKAVAFRLAPLGLAIALAGCDSSQLRVCETQLKDKLKSPASYKRISVEEYNIDSTISKQPYDAVAITYDAANSFNALLRDKEICTFRPGTTEQFDPTGLSTNIETTDLNATDLDATANLDMNATSLNADDALNASAEPSTDNYDVRNDAGE